MRDSLYNNMVFPLYPGQTSINGSKHSKMDAKAKLMTRKKGDLWMSLPPKAVQAVEDKVRCDRRAAIDEIATDLDLSHGAAHVIVREMLHFQQSAAVGVLKMLTDDHKVHCLTASRASLRTYRKKGDAFLSRIVTTNGTWVITEAKRHH